MLNNILLSLLMLLCTSTSTSYASTSKELASKYSSGVKPSVAKMGKTIVEVHESEYFPSLYTNIGTLIDDTQTITWEKAR